MGCYGIRLGTFYSRPFSPNLTPGPNPFSSTQTGQCDIISPIGSGEKLGQTWSISDTISWQGLIVNMWRLAILSYDIAVLRCTTLYCEHVVVPSGHRQRSVSSERGIRLKM
ncbi:hypothetical protein RRG08_030120 [Elysia crispata]|uniref:Uncharacterized protein n=1 Tax=Elysia crispata TaxID=231223 RepID=A0AAE0ZR34_9GAST|nr:hypothetical protein RRG08_030120 [Elysia crispata]